MRNFKFFVIGITALAMALPVSAKKIVPPEFYAFGFSASFNDSTVYFTDIQQIDSAWIDEKTKFVVGRDNYSYQLRDYLAASKFEKNRTCVFVYALKRKDIEKKYIKLKTRYTKGGRFDVKYLTKEDIAFKPIAPIGIEEEQEAEKSKSKSKKDKRNKPPKGMPPGGMQGKPSGQMPNGR